MRPACSAPAPTTTCGARAARRPGCPPGDLPPPRFLSITDDPEGLFETRPPGPGDLAFVLERLHALGHRKLSSAALLAWENPDPIAAGALDHELGRFQSVHHRRTAGPRTQRRTDATRIRAPVGATRPHRRRNRRAADRQSRRGAGFAFRRRLQLGGIHATGKRGLSPLRRLRLSTPVPLLARWGNRVVVALPLAHLMARFDVSADQLVITAGIEIRLGESGPIIPIDIHGQAPVRPGTAGNAVVIPAEELVRPGQGRGPRSPSGRPPCR